MKLSIGKAWDESRQVLARDGKVIALVALALLVVPGTLVGLAAPQPQPQGGGNGVGSALAIFSMLIGLAGQIAISRIALGPPLTVGGAIGVGFKRLPSLFLATLLWTLPFLLALILLLAASGVDFANPSATPPPPLAGIGSLLILLLLLAVAVRMVLTTAAAAGTRKGPIGLLKESWNLTRGNALRMFALVVLVLIVGIVLVVGLGSAINAMVLLALGEPRPWSISALVASLVSQILAAVVSAGLAVLVARVYAQATGGAATGAEPSVPHAGHQ